MFGGSLQSPIPTEMSNEEPPESSYDGEDNELVDGTSLPSGKRQTRRSRTGCWVCRARHLKCDERWPRCGQCVKANRDCRRGLVLKFQHKDNPVVIPLMKSARVIKDYPAAHGEWKFEDNSISIASEYIGGLKQYGFLDTQSPLVQSRPASNPALNGTGLDVRGNFTFSSGDTSTAAGYNNTIGSMLPNLPATYPKAPTQLVTTTTDQFETFESPSLSNRSTDLHRYPGPPAYSLPATQSNLTRSLFNKNEMSLMQVFIADVASWLDTMNTCGYFSHSVPYMALTDKVIRLAIFACASYHQLNPYEPFDAYGTDKRSDTTTVAEEYYEDAKESLREDMITQRQGNPMQHWLVASIILEYYEISARSPGDQIAGFERTRRLFKHIKRSGHIITDTNTTEGACYWSHTALELLTSIGLEHPFYWDSFQMETLPETQINDSNTEVNEECRWSRSILALLIRAKSIISNKHDQQNTPSYVQLQTDATKQAFQNWETRRPGTMKPIAWLEPVLSQSSGFPQISFTSKTSILAQLVYHTGAILISNISSFQSDTSAHGKAICGIIEQLESKILPKFLSPLAVVARRSLHVHHDKINAAYMLVRKFGTEAIGEDLEQGWRPVLETANTSGSINGNLTEMVQSTLQGNPFARSSSEIQGGASQVLQQQLQSLSPQTSHRQQSTTMQTPRQRISSYHSPARTNQPQHNLPMPQIPISHNALQQSPATQHLAMSPNQSRSYSPQIMQISLGFQMSPTRHITNPVSSPHMGSIHSPHTQQILPPNTQYGPY